MTLHTGSGQAAESNDTVATGGIPRSKGSFTIRGHVTGLTPGKRVVLNVRVSNPNPWRIRLHTLTVTAGNASPGCLARHNLSLGSYDFRRPSARRYVIPSKSSSIVSLPIRLVNAHRRNQDKCRNATFPLHYTGDARALPSKRRAGSP
jgi:hypothetical protein